MIRGNPSSGDRFSLLEPFGSALGAARSALFVSRSLFGKRSSRLSSHSTGDQ